MELQLSVTTDEANAIFAVLGQLPTSSGAWPLMMKLKDQIDKQTGAAEEEAPAPAQVARKR